MVGVLCVALLIGPASLITWACRPGYMNADTLAQYDVARGAPSYDWHAPLITWLWGGADAIGIGRPTGVLFGQILVLTLGFFLVFRAIVGRVPAAALAAVLVLSPPVLSQAVLIGRDTWFTCFVVAQVALAIRWAGSAHRWRGGWLVLSGVAGFLAMASRQNGAALVLFVAAAPIHRLLAARWTARDATVTTWRRVVSTVGAALGATLLGVVGLWGAVRALGTTDTAPESMTFAYDLAGLSLQTDEVLVPEAAYPEQDLAELRGSWDPSNVLSLVVDRGDGGPLLAIEHDTADEIADAWREEVAAHPAEYVQVRWTLFSRILGISAPPTVVMHHGVDDSMNRWDFAIANPEANDVVRSYVSVLATDGSLMRGSFVARPVLYLVAGLAAGAYLLARRRSGPGGPEVALLALGAVVYELTFLVGAMGEGFRFSYPMVTCCLLAVVFASTTTVTGRRSRRQSEAPAEGTVATA